MTAHIVIYTTPQCGYCQMAKELLKRRGWPYSEVDVARDPAQRAALVKTTGRRTVPQIFINDQPIGGFDELHALDTSGALTRLVTEPQAPHSDNRSAP